MNEPQNQGDELREWNEGNPYGDCLATDRSEEAFSSRDLIDYLWKGFRRLYQETV